MIEDSKRTSTSPQASKAPTTSVINEMGLTEVNLRTSSSTRWSILARGRGEGLRIGHVDVRSATVKRRLSSIGRRQALAHFDPADRFVTEQLDERGHVLIPIVFMVEAVRRIVGIQYRQASVSHSYRARRIARRAEHGFALNLLLDGW